MRVVYGDGSRIGVQFSKNVFVKTCLPTNLPHAGACLPHARPLAPEGYSRRKIDKREEERKKETKNMDEWHERKEGREGGETEGGRERGSA